MDVDRDKLGELAKSLTDDQRRLLREGLGGGEDLDPDTLAESLRSFDTGAMLDHLAATSSPLDASSLTFKKNSGPVGPVDAGEPVVLRLDQAPATLGDAVRIAQERTGREVTMSEVRVLDLDPSEATEVTLKRLATQDLKRKVATGRRMVRVPSPSLSTSISDLDNLQHEQTGTTAAARRVVVVIILGPIVIIIVFPPPEPTPPPEPPLTRW